VSGSSSIFNGASRYSSDFSAWIDRAVGIASLQLMQLQSQRAALSDRRSALQGLDAKVSALQTSVTTLASSLGLSSFKISNSDSAVVTATVSEGIREGDYQIEVIDIGSNATTLSKAPGGAIAQVTDPAVGNISASQSFKLYLDGATSPVVITPSGTTLNDLADAIEQADPNLRAVVVNVGGLSGADYRLSIQHKGFAPHTIALTDSADNPLLDMVDPGSYAKYKINNGNEVETDTHSVTLAPGLTVQLLKESANGTPVTLSVTRSANAASDALSAFVNAYNAVVQQLDQSRGQNGGALAGDASVGIVSDALQQITSYVNLGSGLNSLAAVGVTLSDKGVMSFDASAFDAAVANNFDALSSLLGDSEHPGFLSFASQILNGLEDASAGALKTGLTSLDDQISAQDASIAREQERVDQYEKTLREQMYAADALIAALEQQVTYFTSMFEAMRIAQQSLS